MNDKDKLQLIELKRHELETLLIQATGIDVGIVAHIHPRFQDTRPLGCAAARAGWPVAHGPENRYVRSPHLSALDYTVIYVPRDLTEQNERPSSPRNPLNNPPSPLEALDAFVGLARLSCFMPIEEED